MARPHQTARLCTQVQRAIELALAGDVGDEVLQAIWVAAVEPAPDDRRLRVRFVVPDSAAALGREAIAQRLEAARGVLIDEVVRSIHRRRCPELVFVLERAPALPPEP